WEYELPSPVSVRLLRMLVEIALYLPARLAELMNWPSNPELAPKLAITEASTWAALASIDWEYELPSPVSVRSLRMLVEIALNLPVRWAELVTRPSSGELAPKLAIA